jgi:hypothetical protein
LRTNIAGEVSEYAAVVSATYRALEEEDTLTLAGWVDPQLEWIH